MSRKLVRSMLVACVMVATLTTGTGVAVAHSSSVGLRGVGSCHAEVDRWWPAQHRAWAHRIVTRESGGFAGAANPRSSARGCFQMLLRYSSRFYRSVGCSNAQWYVARCNVRAAYAMFRVAGRSPWRLY